MKSMGTFGETFAITLDDKQLKKKHVIRLHPTGCRNLYGETDDLSISGRYKEQ